MSDKPEKWVCSAGGYTADATPGGEVSPESDVIYWKCSSCGMIVATATPPDVCPECRADCTFINVTCYTPECGGPGHIDRRL